MVMLVVFFVGYVNIHSDVVGLPRMFPISEPLEEFWEVFSWIIFAALVADVYLKYRKINDPKAFVKKHWLDITMLVLIPVFAGFKIAKLSVNLVKSLKMGKSGLKAFLSTKKIKDKKPT